MKIAVTRCDGDTEIITLNEPVTVGRSSLHSAEGMDHFFRESDGRYDGYGMGAPSQGWTEQQAKTMLQSIQREIIPVTIRGVLSKRFQKLRWFVQWHWHHFKGTPGF